MHLSKEDRTGLAVSIGFHILVLAMLAWLTVSASETQPMGFLEVEFGPFSEGRPVRQAPVQNQPEPQPQEEQPEQERRTPVAPPENVKPVELPDADQSQADVEEETVDVPKAEVIAPEKSTTKEEKPDEKPQEAKEVVRPLGSGALTKDDGADTGDEGKSNQEQASAPFQIEGLNREAQATPLPNIRSDRDVIVTVQIEVDPRGNVTSVIPLRRGDPVQDREVMQTVRKWKFNALPSNAPQETQKGRVTFVIRLR